MSGMEGRADWDLTIREAGAAFRAGTRSPVELTVAILKRIEETEPVVHAYVQVMTDAALAAAHQAEDELEGGYDRGPLHGIPIAIKDIIDIAGRPTLCGSQVRDDSPAALEDATVVAQLRQAGAVLVGKTVTHEFAGGVISPPTRNPWNPSHIPGGSSGGSGAAVAAGSCLAALGSDTAGSIRIPSALNGVVGLKPTYGCVSNRGVFPLSWSLDTVGPLTKTVDDTALVMGAILRHHPRNSAAMAKRTTETGDELDGNLEGVRLGVPRPYFFDRLQPGVRSTVEKALVTLAALGAEVIDTPWQEASAASAAGFVVVRPEMAAVHAEALRTVPERFGPVLRSRLEAFSLFPARGYLRAQRARSATRSTIAALFAAHQLDALVTPTVPATASPVDQTLIAYADGDEPVHSGFTRLTMPFNATGQPALSLPCGLDAARLPVGLQIVGAPFTEPTLYRIGHAYEGAAGWNAGRVPL
jgi:aspartyl-tRNA(Asn)/glutamyl-tRNA(Gln) amidotransferase subunit A